MLEHLELLKGKCSKHIDQIGTKLTECRRIFNPLNSLQEVESMIQLFKAEVETSESNPKPNLITTKQPKQSRKGALAGDNYRWSDLSVDNSVRSRRSSTPTVQKGNFQLKQLYVEGDQDAFPPHVGLFTGTNRRSKDAGDMVFPTGQPQKGTGNLNYGANTAMHQALRKQSGKGHKPFRQAAPGRTAVYAYDDIDIIKEEEKLEQTISPAPRGSRVVRHKIDETSADIGSTGAGLMNHHVLRGARERQ
jgi:hypothetical protein